MFYWSHFFFARSYNEQWQPHMGWPRMLSYLSPFHNFHFLGAVALDTHCLLHYVRKWRARRKELFEDRRKLGSGWGQVMVKQQAANLNVWHITKISQRIVLTATTITIYSGKPLHFVFGSYRVRISVWLPGILNCGYHRYP